MQQNLEQKTIWKLAYKKPLEGDTLARTEMPQTIRILMNPKTLCIHPDRTFSMLRRVSTKTLQKTETINCDHVTTKQKPSKTLETCPDCY
jgi:hypothetical protein